MGLGGVGALGGALGGVGGRWGWGFSPEQSLDLARFMHGWASPLLDKFLFGTVYAIRFLFPPLNNLLFRYGILYADPPPA